MLKVEFHVVLYPKGTSPDGVTIITNLTSGKAAVCRSLRLQEANSIHLAAQRRQQFVGSSFGVFSLATQNLGFFPICLLPEKLFLSVENYLYLLNSEDFVWLLKVHGDYRIIWILELCLTPLGTAIRRTTWFSTPTLETFIWY